MNIIGNYSKKPNAYYIGKLHEQWAYKLIRNQPDSEIVTKWMKALSNESLDKIVSFNSVLPESHTEKSDFLVSMVCKENGIKKAKLEGISAKSGTTSMHGQIYRGSLESVIGLGFIPNYGALYEQHDSWLKKRQSLKDIINLDLNSWKDWYQNRWDEIIEKTLFGTKTHASSLLLSNLEYNENTNDMRVLETVIVSKEQALKDLKLLSPSTGVEVNLKDRGIITSGFISIQRAGGSNGEKGAEDFQVRLDRYSYIKYLRTKYPENIWHV